MVLYKLLCTVQYKYTVNYTFYRIIVLILTGPKWCRDSKAIKDRKLCYIFRKGFENFNEFAFALSINLWGM